MALTFTAKLKLPASQLPEGSINDTLTDFSGETTAREFFEYRLFPASSVDNNVQATALTAIKTAVETYIEVSFAPSIGIDAAATIVGDAVITNIDRGWQEF